MLSASQVQSFADPQTSLHHRSTAHETPLKNGFDEEEPVVMEYHAMKSKGLKLRGLGSSASKVKLLDLSKVSKPLSPSS